VALYLETLEQASLPHDQPFLEAVRSHLEFGSRVAQQNSRAQSDADLHPIRAVRTGTGRTDASRPGQSPG
jgi:hemoglobin